MAKTAKQRVAIFSLSGEVKGKDVTIGRYNFAKGKLITSESDGKKLENILCRYHACDVEYKDADAPESDEGGSEGGSLSAESTKGGGNTPAPVSAPEKAK